MEEPPDSKAGHGMKIKDNVLIITMMIFAVTHAMLQMEVTSNRYGTWPDTLNNTS